MSAQLAIEEVAQFPPNALTIEENNRLEELESVIERGLETFYQVGSALSEIRDGRLYRAEYGAFEDYCRERWRFSRQRAHQLINASRVYENLSTIVDRPTTESQARELAPLDAEAQKAVWQIVLKTAPVSDEGKPLVTAQHVKSVAQVLTEVVQSGGLDDGSGEVKPLGVLIDAAITEETYERLMRQKEHVKQSRDVKREAKTQERQSLKLKMQGVAFSKRCKLIHGDFVSVAESSKDIKPGSVDSIITDPPYGKGVVSLCEALAQCAVKWLKPGGSLVVMVGQYQLPSVLWRMSQWIDYQWTLAYLTPGGQSPQIFPRKVNTFWKPVLWFVNGKEYAGEWIGDVAKSDVNDNDKRFHEWGQSESGMADLIERFSKPGDTILDPFLGGGTTGAVALSLDRRFIGVDKDAKAVQTARERYEGLFNAES